MPPAISDEENSESDVAFSSTSLKRSAKDKKPARYSKAARDADDEDEDMFDVRTNGKEPEEDEPVIPGDEESAEEYVVEKIMDHRFEGGVLKFEVKWEGYEKKSDRTWEPEDHLKENASSILEEYYVKMGGRDRIIEETRSAFKNKKRARSHTNSAAATPTPKRANSGGSKRPRRSEPHPAESTPPASLQDEPRETKSNNLSNAWRPPAGSWEDEVSNLDACEDEESGRLMVYLTWKNGHKTQHETSVVYKRCPQKMLQFYERHVRIIKKDVDEQAAPTWPS